MSVMNGFTVRSEEEGRGFTLPELNNLSFSGRNLSGEPVLRDMLIDPVVRAMMRRDGVRAEEVKGLMGPRFEPTAHLGRRRRGSPA